MCELRTLVRNDPRRSGHLPLLALARVVLAVAGDSRSGPRTANDAGAAQEFVDFLHYPVVLLFGLAAVDRPWRAPAEGRADGWPASFYWCCSPHSLTRRTHSGRCSSS